MTGITGSTYINDDGEEVEITLGVLLSTIVNVDTSVSRQLTMVNARLSLIESHLGLDDEAAAIKARFAKPNDQLIN